DQFLLQGGAQALDRVLPQGAPPEFVRCIENAVRETLNKHGHSAFSMPRVAAIAHEAGHAIVAAHEGQIFRSVKIESRLVPGFGMVWGGCCSADGTWSTGPDTTAQSDLSRARIVIAGLVAEKLCGLGEPGSSMDERAVATALISN